MTLKIEKKCKMKHPRVSYDVVKLLSAQSNAKVSELQDKSGARIKVGVFKKLF